MKPSVHDINSKEDINKLEAKILQERKTLGSTFNRFNREVIVTLETFKRMQRNQELYSEDGINYAIFTPILKYVQNKVLEKKEEVQALMKSIKKDLTNNPEVFDKVDLLCKQSLHLIEVNKLDSKDFDLREFETAIAKLEKNAEALEIELKAQDEAKKLEEAEKLAKRVGDIQNQK